MSDIPSFAKLVPGFDFLQGLVKNAGAALPSIGQWVAPTLNPEELEKRIGELRTVQFWLEQNARMLGATIQALEVQRMTLSTLKTMNVQMEDLRDSLQIRLPGSTPAAAPAPAAASLPSASNASQASPAADDAASADAAPATDANAASRTTSPRKAGADGAASNGPSGGVDPLQWWGALTRQFTELATHAMKDTAADAAKGLAGHMMKKSFEAAGDSLKQALPGAAGRAAKRPAAKSARRAAAKKRTPAAR